MSRSVNRWSVESMFRLSPGAAALAALAALAVLLSVLKCTQTLLSAGSKLQAAKP